MPATPGKKDRLTAGKPRLAKVKVRGDDAGRRASRQLMQTPSAEGRAQKVKVGAKAGRRRVAAAKAAPR